MEGVARREKKSITIFVLCIVYSYCLETEKQIATRITQNYSSEYIMSIKWINFTIDYKGNFRTSIYEHLGGGVKQPLSLAFFCA